MSLEYTWDAGIDGRCQRCPNPVAQGMRYVTVEGGIVHVSCPKPGLRLLPPPPADEADEQYDEQLSAMAEDAAMTCPTPPGARAGGKVDP